MFSQEAVDSWASPQLKPYLLVLYTTNAAADVGCLVFCVYGFRRYVGLQIIDPPDTTKPMTLA